MNSKILIVEDDDIQREVLAEMLDYKLEFGSISAKNGQEALDILSIPENRQKIKLAIMDIDMPVMNGIDTLKVFQKQYTDLPVIMLTGRKNIEKAVECMKLGAVDFLNKPFDVTRMVVTIKNAIRMSTLSKEITRLKTEQTNTFTFDSLIGSQTGLSETVRLGKKAAASDIPIIITGETGTGKEVFAKAIHGESERADKPFIAINCGAIPDQLIESTLFGHEKGAFTGATEANKGKFREANGGTIFLDEIGELPLEAQVKLLRVLQQQEVESVGGTHPIPVNVRILSATNRDLDQSIKKGTFREDLYFRLNVFPLNLPTLQERKEDIPLLANYFLKNFSKDNNTSKKRLSSQVHHFLENTNWPGNIRQLENSIYRAFVISDRDIIEIDDFQNMPELESFNSEIPIKEQNYINNDNIIKTMDEIEKDAINFALAHFNHNITKAAKALGLAKSTFYRKMKNYNLS